MMLQRARFFAILLLFALLSVGSLVHSVSANALGRDSDPVLLVGGELSELIGTPPQQIVAFRWNGLWEQIPVQVDERAWVDYGQVYNTDLVGISVLAYCDTGTFTGADPDAFFDADDELVFLAADAGQIIPFGVPDPAGTLAGSRLDLRIDDPIDGGSAWVALYRSDEGLDPAAEFDGVSYDFDLLSGEYLTTYNTMTGPNPENSVITTASYRMHFQDRWIRDELYVDADGASGVDILDRHKNLFAPQNCARSEDTFSAGEGAFFCNIDGPVRAIRSYAGANSGPFTTRTHWFYPQRHDVATDLRVHAITGVMDFYDYGPAANGMTYLNDLNLDGVPVDGVVNETVSPGPLVWEMLTGAQGTLSIALRVTTDIPGFDYTSYWLDDASTSVTQCTGDADAYGSSGLWVTQPIPNTDPYLGAHSTMNIARIEYLEGPGGEAARAQLRYEQATRPLLAQVVVPTVTLAEPRSRPVLLEASPNPFNPSTVIRYSLPRDGQVDLAVYDTFGRRIRTLMAGFRPAGEHSLTWNGRDHEGKVVSSGVYLYQLRSGRFAETKRMVLLK